MLGSVEGFKPEISAYTSRPLGPTGANASPQGVRDARERPEKHPSGDGCRAVSQHTPMGGLQHVLKSFRKI